MAGATSSYPTVQSRGNGANRSGTPEGATSLVEAFLAADPDGAMGGKGDEECAAKLVAVGQRWKQAHRVMWPQWAEAQGMTYGDQYGTVSFDAKTFWQPRTPAPEKKVTRIQIPHMSGIIEDVASLQCQDEMNMKCSPPNDSARAAASCEAGDQIVQWIWDDQDLDDVNYLVREEAACVGTSFIYPQFDMSAGAEVEQVVGYEPVPGPPDPVTGAPTGMGLKPKTAKVREGGFAHEFISCFEALPDPASKAEWDGEGFIIEQKIPIALLRARYPDFADAFTSDSAPGASDGSFYADRIKGINPRGIGSYAGAAQAQQSERSTVLTVFLRSCPEFPLGRWAVVCHGKLVFKGDNPVYPNEREQAGGESFPPYHWPVFRFVHRAIKGSYWGQGLASKLIDTQKKLNGVASKFLHMLKRTSHPVLVKPKRADFVKTDEPDQQINVPTDVQPGSIYYLAAPTFPPELQYAERYAVEQMETLAGIHAGTRGASQGGDSGTKQRQLFQRDLGRLEKPKRRSDKQMGRLLSYDLRQWRRYATVPRTLKITGENMATAVKQFDMASIAPGTDVVVYSDLSMPKDPAGRILHVEKASQMGAIDMKDPVTRAGVARLLGFPGWAKQFESMQYADQRRADAENLRMYAGEAPPVEFWHNHAQDLARHYAEMNTETWISSTTPLPGDPPQVAQKKLQTRQTFLAHVQMHQAALDKLRQTEQAQAMPKEIMNFKDLPPTGQAQMAAQSGIKIADPSQPPPDGAAPSPGPGATAPPTPPSPAAQPPQPASAQAGPPPQKAAA